MSVINKEDFRDWKDNLVTKAVFMAIQDRIEEAKETLASSAGLESSLDNYLRGFIQSNQELLRISFDDMEGE
jgi:hypothetical protein